MLCYIVYLIALLVCVPCSIVTADSVGHHAQPRSGDALSRHGSLRRRERRQGGRNGGGGWNGSGNDHTGPHSWNTDGSGTDIPSWATSTRPAASQKHTSQTTTTSQVPVATTSPSTSTSSSAPSTSTDTSIPSALKGTVTGKGTYYYQGGVAGSCGTVSADSDKVVAVQESVMTSSLCGKTVVITNTANGKSVTATIMDTCPGCDGSGSLDLSTGAFDSIGEEATGVLSISWYISD